MSDFFPHGHVALQYGVLRGNGTSERAIFVIDAGGVVRHVHIYDIDVLPPLEPILEALDAMEGKQPAAPSH